MENPKSTEEQTLYEKYGGKATVEKVVEQFYKLNLKDERILKFFKDIDLEKLKKHQIAFVSIALGGPNDYSGRDMKAAHANMGLTSEHFDAVVENLTSAVFELGVSETDIGKVCEVLEGFRDKIIQAA